MRLISRSDVSVENLNERIHRRKRGEKRIEIPYVVHARAYNIASSQ